MPVPLRDGREAHEAAAGAGAGGGKWGWQVSTKEKIELALAAMGGPKHRPEACMCDPEVGACPCYYCAELDGLNEALKVVEQNAALRAALEPFARRNLSFECYTTDLLLRSPEAMLRQQADQIAKEDREILAARAALGIGGGK